MDVHLPDGVTVQVPYGETRTFPDEVARGLLEQGEEHWQLISHYGHEPEPADYKGPWSAGYVAREMIRRLRNDRGWTQTALAERLTQAGLPLGQTDVSKIESGTREVTVDDLIVICAALNVSPSRVLEGAQLDPQPSVTVIPSVTVPLSRFRRWIRGHEPLPAAKDWHKATGRPWANSYRAVLAPEDLLRSKELLISDLVTAVQEIADAAREARDQLSAETRTRLADALDEFDAGLKRLYEHNAAHLRLERRGRPRNLRPN